VGEDPTLLDRWELRQHQLAEDDIARTADAYGKNYERIQRVKTEYDPDNFFRVNRNIPPA
jgi:FAD/FMN-containing dehydrogenase